MSKFKLSKRLLAAGLMVAAASFPAVAQARLNFDPPSKTAASAPAPAVSAQASPPTRDSSFQWGDAAIGAAGAVVLVGAGAAATSGARRRRGQRQLAG
jgi:hypothetical protein